VLVIASTLFSACIGYAQTQINAGPDADWAAALDWMRSNTPEPMGDPAAWSKRWPAPAPATRFVYPPSACGILVEWDKGWFVSGSARRIPSANGEVDGAIDTSRFLLETDPNDALQNLRSNGMRYVAIGPGQISTELPSIARMGAHDLGRYARIFYLQAPGQPKVRLNVFLPAFYRSMAARLYLYDGQRVEAKKGIRVFLTSLAGSASAAVEPVVQSVREFPSEKDAEKWIDEHPLESATPGSDDPTTTCVDLDEIP